MTVGWPAPTGSAGAAGALAACCGDDTLVVTKLDQLARSILDPEALHQAVVTLRERPRSWMSAAIRRTEKHCECLRRAQC